MSPIHKQTEIFISISDVVIFPHAVERIKLTRDLNLPGRHVVLVYLNQGSHSKTAVLCEVIDDQVQQDGHFLVLEGMQRVSIHNINDNMVTFTRYEEVFELSDDLKTLSQSIYSLFQEHHRLLDNEDLSMETLLSVIHPDQPNELADFIASYLPINYPQKLELIESVNVYHRLELIQKHLNQLLIDLRVDHQLDSVIQANVESERKEMLLRAKLRAIQLELNTLSQADIADGYRSKLQS